MELVWVYVFMRLVLNFVRLVVLLVCLIWFECLVFVILDLLCCFVF